MLSLFTLILVTQLSGEPADTTAVRTQIDRELISVSALGWQTMFRKGERSFSLVDEDWSTAFALVPESQALARSLKESFDFGMTMVRVGVGIELLALGGAVALLLTAGAAVLPALTIVWLAIACGGLGLVGGIIAVIGLPALARAQTGSFELVASYNHALTRQPLVPPGLVIPLGL